MRFTVVDLLVVVVVVAISLSLNSVERERHVQVTKGTHVLFDFRYPYYGYPFEAYHPSERGGRLVIGAIGNSLITLAGTMLAIFLVRKLLQFFSRNTPPADPPVS